MSTVHFEHLFSPLQVGPMRVPNRICETTNTINSSMTPGLIDEHFVAHHGAKARGGTGWIGGETWLLDLPMPPVAPEEVSLRGASARGSRPIRIRPSARAGRNSSTRCTTAAQWSSRS